MVKRLKEGHQKTGSYAIARGKRRQRARRGVREGHERGTRRVWGQEKMLQKRSDFNNVFSYRERKRKHKRPSLLLHVTPLRLFSMCANFRCFERARDPPTQCFPQRCIVSTRSSAIITFFYTWKTLQDLRAACLTKTRLQCMQFPSSELLVTAFFALQAFAKKIWWA